MQVGGARRERWAGRLVTLAVLSGLLAGCGAVAEQVNMTVASPRLAATSTFQGSVTAVDVDAGTMAVDVWMVWAPVMEARAHERQVVADSTTQWEPEPGGMAQVQLGEEVQVEAEDSLDGTWRATRILMIDVD